MCVCVCVSSILVKPTVLGSTEPKFENGSGKHFLPGTTENQKKGGEMERPVVQNVPLPPIAQRVLHGHNEPAPASAPSTGCLL
jgi:hypothetical protein